VDDLDSGYLRFAFIVVAINIAFMNLIGNDRRINDI
jgi:hypothetical protein